MIERVFTVDGKFSQDLDDALRILRRDDGWLVSVYVADVASGVPPGSPLDHHARRFGFTRYHGERAVHRMFPKHLSEDAWSLSPGAVKSAIAVDIPLSATLDVGPVSVRRTSIENVCRLSYGALSQASVEMAPMVCDAVTIAKGLFAKRFRSGGHSSFATDTLTFVDEEGGSRIFQSLEEATGYILVQEFMILANIELARLLVEAGRPAIFRNHAAPSKDRPGVLPSAEMGIWGTGHHGLRSEFYAWFTSPIRRYPDLVNQRLLLDLLEDRPPSHSERSLKKIAAEFNDIHLRHRTETTARYRQFAYQKLMSRISWGDLSTLSVGEFSAVVRETMEARDRVDIVVDEAIRRLEFEILLTPKDLLRILVVDDPVVDRFLDVLSETFAKRPGLVSNLFNYLDQCGMFENVHIDEGRNITQNWVKVVVSYNGTRIEASSEGGSLSRLRCRAQLEILSGIFGIPVRETAQARTGHAPRPLVPPVVDGWRDSKSRLSDWIQANRLPYPIYARTEEGPSSRRLFRVVVSVPGFGEAEGEPATTARHAEKNAAAAFLEKVGRELQATMAPAP